jgi:hypothetical protein
VELKLGKDGRRAEEEGVKVGSVKMTPRTAGFLHSITWRGRIEKVQRQQKEEEHTEKHDTNSLG